MPMPRGTHKNHAKGPSHYLWKGDKAGYGAVHKWVARVKGRPQKCEECGKTDATVYHWANLSGKYLRIVEDWKRLCVPCHRKHDKLAYQNGKAHKDNTSGYKGVYYRPLNTLKKWEARATPNGKTKSLGYYTTAEEAHEARLKYLNS